MIAAEDWIASVKTLFAAHARPDLAPGMSAYMKNHFPFWGIQSKPRAELFREIEKNLGFPDFENAQKLLPLLMEQPEREWQYLAIELGIKQKFFKTPAALPLFEACFEKQAWWDSVDPMAVHWFGKYFLQFPDQIPDAITKYTLHPNFWYQRLSMLYALKYKSHANKDLLLWSMRELAGSKEFFVQKGMGWVLREHSKTDPFWVKRVLAQVPVSNLTRREASKYL